MLLSDIVKTLFYRSGQYILQPDLSQLKLNMEGIWLALETEFRNYTRYNQIEKRFTLTMGGYFYYDFTADSNNVGYQVGEPFTNDFGEQTFNIGDTTINVTLTEPITLPTSFKVYFDDILVAVDDGSNNLVFTNNGSFTTASDFTGVVSYTDGSVRILGDLEEITTYCIKVSATWNNPGIPPRVIGTVNPVGVLQSIAILPYWISPLNTQQWWSPDRLVAPRTFLWRYERPVLFYSAVGTVDVKAIYDHQFIKVYNDDETPIPGQHVRLKDVNIPGIEDDPNYKILEDLLLGRFMQIVGRSRRAFTFNELPITTDAKEMVAEGTDIYEKAEKALYSRHKWWRAIRS
jgi:hypothetical protein